MTDNRPLSEKVLYELLGAIIGPLILVVSRLCEKNGGMVPAVLKSAEKVLYELGGRVAAHDLRPVHPETRRSELITALQAASTAIASWASIEWPGWICWMLEALDEEAKAQGFDLEPALAKVASSLRTRITEGNW